MKRQNELREAKSIRSVHLWRYNYIRKALHILLNDSLIEMALYSDSAARDVCNFFAHPPTKGDEEFFDLVNRLPEISKQCPKPMDEYQAQMYKEDMESLGKLCYGSDSYFDDKRSDLEVAVDVHLEKWINIETTPLNGAEQGDARVLLSWLDKLHPAE